MPPSSKFPFRCSFGKPHHGWLPIQIVSETGAITFIASDVPNNPVQDLIDAVEATCQGFTATVWWHLEPDGYYFKFTPTANDVDISILFAESSQEHLQTEIARFKGSKERILLPLWRELRKLEAAHPVEPHWPPVNFNKLSKIREKLR